MAAKDAGCPVRAAPDPKFQLNRYGFAGTMPMKPGTRPARALSLSPPDAPQRADTEQPMGGAERAPKWRRKTPAATGEPPGPRIPTESIRLSWNNFAGAHLVFRAWDPACRVKFGVPVGFPSFPARTGYGLQPCAQPRQSARSTFAMAASDTHWHGQQRTSEPVQNPFRGAAP